MKRLLLATLGAIALTTLSGAPASAQAAPFVGQTMIIPTNFCPLGWLEMDGRVLQTTEYSVLFFVIGKTYGGDGQTTFALPTAPPLFTTDGKGLRHCIAATGIYPSQS